MHRLIRAIVFAYATRHLWAVLYSLLEDKCQVKMQGTNSYGHNKQPWWTPYIVNLNY